MVSALDLDPIYCAEQIHVPPELSDVLKAFTKEVVRTQPSDILEFASMYFHNLASVATEDTKSPTPPTEEQLQGALAKLSDREAAERSEIMNASIEVGIDKKATEEAIRLVDVQEGEYARPSSVLVLLLTMAHPTLERAVEASFRVFGDEMGMLEPKEFAQLFGSATSADPAVTPAVKERLSSELEEFNGRKISFTDVSGIPSLVEIFRPAYSSGGVSSGHDGPAGGEGEE